MELQLKQKKHDQNCDIMILHVHFLLLEASTDPKQLLQQNVLEKISAKSQSVEKSKVRMLPHCQNPSIKGCQFLPIIQKNDAHVDG